MPGSSVQNALTSDAGRDQHATENNHGTLYEMQTTILALVFGGDEVARCILEEAKRCRSPVQIKPDRGETKLVQSAHAEVIAKLTTLIENSLAKGRSTSGAEQSNDANVNTSKT